MSIQTWPRLQSLVLELALPLFQEVFMASIAPSAGYSGLSEFGLIPNPVVIMYVVVVDKGSLAVFFPHLGGCLKQRA